MLALRRLFLVLFVFAVPAAMAAAFYYGALAVLAATHRTIDPEFLKYICLAGFAVFVFLAILEAKDRW